MRLVRIDLENFRLLQGVSVALSKDQDTTVFVGPNNSGKTSMAEALGLLLSAEKPSISDFSITSYGAFAAFEKVAIAPEPAADAETAQVALPALPRIVLKLHFDYSETPEDLRIAEAFLMDLEEGSSRIVAELEYAVRDPELLKRDFRTRHAETKETLVDFLSQHLHDHYGYRLYKMSADGAERTARRARAAGQADKDRLPPGTAPHGG